MKVTLFPFLSVLLCMMGAMIMLLVVVAKNVREQAVAPAAALQAENIQTLSVQEAEEQREKIALRTEDADWLAENYSRAQTKAEEELADIQNKLAVAEKETQKLRDEIQRLQQLAKQLAAGPSATEAEAEQLKQLLAQQQQRKEQAEVELAEIQKEAEKKKQSYAIVPYRGENGTFRKPIYIECRDNKIIIQPEGIELVPGDFLAADRPDNVFDTVLRVIRQYYSETNQTARGEEPYPLWIIRPSGAAMYDNARQATGNWVKEFGYEIANEDWTIEYPPVNEELRNRIARQLEISRSRLSGYMVAQRMAERSFAGQGSGLEYRVDHRGNVLPTGNFETANLRRQTADGKFETADGRRQTAADASVATEPQPADVDSPAATPPTLLPSAVCRLPSDSSGSPQPAKKQSRPSNWALKDAVQYASGISRTVRVRCESDRYVLTSQVGLPQERVIPIANSAGQSAGSAVDRLVQAVWEYQDTWGRAGENVYWRPRLQVQVVPGGEGRFAELKEHLQGSGLSVE